MRKIGDWLISNYPLSKFITDAVLIIKLDAIGDFILWLDAVREIRTLYPDKKIVLCANSAWADLAKFFPYWDEIIPVEFLKFRDNLVYRYKILMRIRLRRFRVAIQPTFSRVYLHGDSLIRASGAVERIGSLGDLTNINRRDKDRSDKYYTRLIPGNPAHTMEIARNAEFVRGLGAKDFLGSVTKIDELLELPPELRIAKPYCVIFPGASMIIKIWSADKFTELIGQIQQSLGLQIVLCGGSGDIFVCNEITAQSAVPVINFAGKTSLAQLVEVVRSARILISNDTSAVHIAAAVGTPSVCILGGGQFGRFIPYDLEKPSSNPVPIAVYKRMDCFGCNWSCKFPLKAGRPPCINDIAVEQVLTACASAVRSNSL